MSKKTLEIRTIEADFCRIYDCGDDSIQVLRDTVAKDCTPAMFKLFLQVAKLRGLDPFSGQIHAIVRKTRDQPEGKLCIQIGIDGFRARADSTGEYRPGREPEFEEKDGKLISCTAYIKRKTGDEWVEYTGTARWNEFVPAQKWMWEKMPYHMLAKCAEAVAFRKTFPQQLGGFYEEAEMDRTELLTVPNAQVIDPNTDETEMSNKDRWDGLVKFAKNHGLGDKDTFLKLVFRAIGWNDEEALAIKKNGEFERWLETATSEDFSAMWQAVTSYEGQRAKP